MHTEDGGPSLGGHGTKFALVIYVAGSSLGAAFGMPDPTPHRPRGMSGETKSSLTADPLVKVCSPTPSTHLMKLSLRGMRQVLPFVVMERE